MTEVQERFEWRFVDADDREREAFPTLAAVLARAEPEPVAPPNRLREVRRARGPDGRVYFLKLFRRVQTKNLLRNLTTLPRAATDGAREAAMATALRAAGWRAPRPVAVASRGRRSALLLAEMAGEPLRDRVEAGRCPRVLADRVADHCGRLLHDGFALPDLSAEHVLLSGDDPQSCAIGVLDLHDGTLGGVRRRTLRRVLRRFQRSLHGLWVPRLAALRFAVRLCRAAGARSLTRRIVRSVPPLDTHGRYDANARARRYAERSPKRTARELGLLRRVWPGVDGARVLDAPCGAGRLAATLGDLGASWSGADRSRAMLAACRERVGEDATLCAADSTALPFADRAFDGVVVFRFLHHLPPAVARAAALEACRVADGFVVLTFFHPLSAHNLRRRTTERLRGRSRTRFSLTRATLDAWMDSAGFRRVATAAEAPFLRDLWVTAYARRPVSPRSG